MALTGDPDGPPLAPATGAADVVDAALAPFGLDAGVLAERAASGGLGRSGRLACGRGSRLLRAADGWLALTLSRPDDVASLPALLEVGFDGEPDGTGDGAPWDAVARAVAGRPAAEVAGRAELLGMPCGVVGEAAPDPLPAPLAPLADRRPPPYAERRPHPYAERRPHPYAERRPPVCGTPPSPICGGSVGAVGWSAGDLVPAAGGRHGGQGRGRPPARRRPARATRRSTTCSTGASSAWPWTWGRATGRRALASLVDRADIVVTSARARAVEALGLDPPAALAAATDKVWVAITAHGWASPRVGFGDDVAAAAGLVAWHPGDGEPRFAADAIADPLCGALAAHAALAAWHRGGRHFVDASLAAAARSVAPPAAEPARAARGGGGGGWSIDGEPVAAPRPRAADRPAAPLGADTAAVLAAVSA